MDIESSLLDELMGRKSKIIMGIIIHVWCILGFGDE